MVACHEQITSTSEGVVLERLREAVSAAPLTGPRVEGFVVGRQVGAGGMGRVYEALQLHPRRRAAIKVLAGEASGVRERFFRREADALARLQHPGIANVYTSGTTASGEAYFAMEFAEGQTLDAWASQRGRPVRDVLRVMIGVCRAVQHAHERGVIHRDLKPSNIMVDEAGRPKVLDFGLARLRGHDAGATFDGRLAGTLAYMSPEQFSARTGVVDERSDVYALGVVLFEVLTGEPPVRVDGLALADAASAVRRGPARTASAARPDLPGSIDIICTRSMARTREDRYAGAGALADDLERVLAGLPVRRVHGKGARRCAGVLLLAATLLWACLGVHWSRSDGPATGAARTVVASDARVHRLGPLVTVVGDLEAAARQLQPRFDALRAQEPGEPGPEQRAAGARLALMYEALGRYEDAEALFRLGASWERGISSRRVLALGHAALCMAGRGDHEGARRLLTECRRALPRLKSFRDGIRLELEVIEARMALAAGDHPRAKELLERAQASIDPSWAHAPWSRCNVCSAMADACDATEDRAGASAWRRRAERVFSPSLGEACEL